MITAEQRQLRKQFIGSSDAAAILGMDPWRSAADIWLTKTGQVDEASNGAIDAGNRLERAVLDWAEDEIGFAFERDVFRSSGVLCANLDAVISGDPTIVEAKTTGIVGPPDPGYGEQMTDQVPERVIVQVHHQFAVCGHEYHLAWVPVLIGGVGFRMYRVPREEAIVDAVREAALNFHERYVKPCVRPDDFRPSLEVLKRLRREPKSTREVPAEVIDRLIVLGAAKGRAEQDYKDAQRDVLALMGDAEAATVNGEIACTYYEVTRRAHQVQACTFRQLRITKKREE